MLRLGEHRGGAVEAHQVRPRGAGASRRRATAPVPIPRSRIRFGLPASARTAHDARSASSRMRVAALRSATPIRPAYVRVHPRIRQQALLHVETDGSHQARSRCCASRRPGGAGSRNASRPSTRLILEVDVRHARIGLRDLGQRKVVRRDEADGPRLEQRADDGLGPDPAIVGVRTVEHLVEEEERRPLAARQVDDAAVGARSPRRSATRPPGGSRGCGSTRRRRAARSAATSRGRGRPPRRGPC